MALTQRLEIRQSHALVMTPQLMQAIKLLQLSNLDLAAYVETELEKNPLLERGSEEGDAAGVGEPEQQPKADSDWSGESGKAEELDAPEGTTADPDDRAEATPPGADNLPAQSEWAGVGAGGRPDGDYNLEAFVSAEVTLVDHLAEQLTLAVADPVRRMIGRHLIDLVDEAGYLTGDLAEVAEKLGAPAAEVEDVLAILQGFDPAGVCARNLTECLAIQLKELDRFDPAMQMLVKRLDLLAKRDLAALRKACDVSEDDLNDMIAEIRHLNPKPGLAFGSTLVQPIVPDVFVVKAGRGWKVLLCTAYSEAELFKVAGAA